MKIALWYCWSWSDRAEKSGGRAGDSVENGSSRAGDSVDD